MSVTVVGSIQARPGQGGALVAALVPLLEQAIPSARQRQVARLLQNADNPDCIRYVAHWDSREAYQAHVQAIGTQPHDALRASEIGYQYYDQLALYEDMSRHAVIAACVSITAPPAMAAAVRAFVDRQGRQELVGRPGFVLRGVYQDQDVPERLLIVHGWDSMRALDTFIANTAPTLDAHVAEWGARVEVFVGRVCAEVDRYSATAPGPAVPQSSR
jgi:quinol monooxygenase YgiN